jgi:heme/copper-type cytochrome/quinol oxidase subunit 3
VVEAAQIQAPAARPPLPVGARERNSTGWLGLLCLIATEASLFGYLLFSYFFFAVQRGRTWLPDPHPSMSLSGPDTGVLLASSVAVWWAERGVRQGRRGRQMFGLAAAIVLGLIFLVVQAFEWKAKSFSLSSGAYGSLFFVITGFHMAHVVVGVLVLSVLLLWSGLGLFNTRRYEPISIGGFYWHFVDVVWLAVFSTFYLTPYLMA